MDENVNQTAPAMPQPQAPQEPVAPQPVSQSPTNPAPAIPTPAQPPVSNMPTTPMPPSQTPPPPPEVIDAQSSMPPTTVTPKNKLPLFLFCVFVAIVIVIIFFYLTRPKGNNSKVVPTGVPTPIVTTAPTSEPTSSATDSANIQPNPDLPPLYSGIEWEATTEGTITIGKQNREIANTNGFIIKSKTNTGITKPNEFFDYYHNELIKRGWQETLSTSGENGDTQGYEKNNKHITLSSKAFGDIGSGYSLFVEYD